MAPSHDNDAPSETSEDTEAREEREARVAAEALYEKSIVRQDHHLLRHQIWYDIHIPLWTKLISSLDFHPYRSYDDYDWQPFDISYKPPNKKPVVQVDPSDYFYANVRRRSTAGRLFTPFAFYFSPFTYLWSNVRL